MKKVLYITLIILTSVLVGYVLASLSSGQETRKTSTEVTSTQTTGYQVKVPKFTNNETLAKQETYFEQIENLDQLYFYNLDENEDLEAVTYEHKINNENSMQEWEGSINIYKKQNDEWTKVYTYKLTPQIKGDESYFDLRGYIIPLSENKPELLVQDSTNGSGLFTKQIHIKYENGSYITSETPTHQTNPIKLFEFPVIEQNEHKENIKKEINENNWVKWGTIATFAGAIATFFVGLLALAAAYYYEIVVPSKNKKQKLESLKEALYNEIILNIDLLFSGEVENPAHFEVIQELAKNHVGDIKDQEVFDKIQKLYTKLEYYQRFVEKVYLNPHIPNQATATTEKQLQTCNSVLTFFGHNEVNYETIKVTIATDQGGAYIDKKRDIVLEIKDQNIGKWKMKLHGKLNKLF